MAQLIKLQDYVSRYEQDIYVYPSRYVRMKQKQWEGLKEAWENEGLPWKAEPLPAQNESGNKQDLLQKMKWIFQKRKETQEDLGDKGTEEGGDEELALSEVPSTIKSFEDLKQYYLDRLMPFQLKWASSTLTEKSFADLSYLKDESPKYFLQRFPDTFLVMYKPIFLLKKAPVEGEIILITPTAAWCVTLLEEEEDAVYIGSKERFGDKKSGKEARKILSPLLALDRTEVIVKNLFNLSDVDMPVYKAILSRNGYIDYSFPPYGIHFIDKRNYENWFQSMRGLSSPLKHVQLKGAHSCTLPDYRRETDGMEIR